MAVKKCCIDNCNSCSTRKEDKGVTYHKFPKNDSLRDIWVAVTHYKHTDTELPHFVCSRHFCKNDFQSYKDSKYKLKTDAVPSIFPWDSDTEEEMEDISAPVEGFSADCEVENVDAIKKFIEAQEKELQEQKLADFEISEKSNDTADNATPCHSESVCDPASVLGVIHSESETDLDMSKKRDVATKELLSPVDKGNSSMALSIGSKVEAKDFEEKWHTAEIIEVDYEEMEVLIHYEIDRKNSEESVTDTLPISSLKEEPKDMKAEEKIKLTYAVGERCNYEIVFDDGCNWTCNTSRLHKLRSKQGSDTPSTPISYGAGPTNANTQTAFHTHLFDPTRDYLGSKSERREMKRKLNIKEIFNIGQKRSRKQKSPIENAHKNVERKPRILKKRRVRPVKLKLESDIKTEIKTDLPAVDAVASIIGTVTKEEEAHVEDKEDEKQTEVKQDPVQEETKNEEAQPDPEPTDEKKTEIEVDTRNSIDDPIKQNNNEDDLIQLEDLKGELDPVLDEEVKLEQFEKPDDVRHEEVIDRIKEAINKLEDGLSQIEKVNSPKVEIKEEIPTPEVKPTTDNKEESDKKTEEQTEKDKEKLAKVKKGKKLRLLQEKKVKKQVERVKNELKQMKKQMSEMRQQILKRPELAHVAPGAMLPESFLLPNEWCCRWVNGQPLGTVSEIECEVKQQEPGSKPPLPRRSVQVEDKRLPEGWTKHMVRRSFGNSAGKWDVVLVSPDNRRFHTKNEMRVYLENNPSLLRGGYEYALTDFGVHLKLARRMGWITQTAEGEPSAPLLPAGTLSSTSPLFKRKKLSLKKKRDGKDKRPKITIKMKVPKSKDGPPSEDPISSPSLQSANDDSTAPEPAVEVPPLEDGYVYVGSLKVQIIENLLRCPAEGCFKNFRNNTLIQMHIKHYHRELRKMLGDTPKVLDLAYARTKQPIELESPRVTNDKVIKVKIPRPPKREEPKPEVKEVKPELQVDTTPVAPVKEPDLPVPRSQDSPKLRQALSNKPVKRPRVLLPVRRPDPEPVLPEPVNEEVDVENNENIEPKMAGPPLQTLDFESAISTHTVTKPLIEKKRRTEKKRKTFALAAKLPASEEEDWLGANSDFDTRSSFPRSGTPDSKADCKVAPVSSESNEDNKDANMYMYTENLNIMINIDKENKPIKPADVKDIQLGLKTPPSEEQDQERYSQKDNQLGTQSLLSGLLSSPGDASLELPISTSELERLAISVQEQEAQRAMIVAPQPEPPIENSTCRRQLLKHLQRCQALIDARLDSIEAQVAELESQDPSFEDDETAEYFPRTKQTVQMLMRDLETMEELGVIT
ncbi:hypothetical protein HF086_015145 [Spodoptera exigua]|uniref:Uncharacterized protein n=1 Tax=Spodoptera exigua TaxID=7107 RepID=A0A922MC05_SPOEX|nr:hypothetical protein HF086_015145 [Spodoptera exigua]